MEPLQIAASYNRIADRWTSPEFDRSNGIQQLQRAIAFGVRRNRALDVGCGSSGRFFDLLLSHGYSIDGVDISEEMLRLARLTHPAVVLYQADICVWQVPTKYDLICAWDSIWHVPLTSQEDVLRKLCSALTADGILLFTAGGTDGPDERVDACMGVPMYTATLGIPKLCKLLADANCVLRHFEFDQYPEAHVYFIAQRSKEVHPACP